MSGALTEAVLDGGDVVVVKRGHAPGATAAEGAGLRWLAEPAVVPIPVVHGYDEQWLVLDRIDERAAGLGGGGRIGRGQSGRGTMDTAARLGRDLAALHAAGAPAFGSPPPDAPAAAWIGLAPMENTPGPDWPEWYAEHRVRPYVRLARDRGTLSAEEAGAFDRVCDRLPALSGPPEPPSRLHGDLWNGNVLWTRDGAYLIDPAAHGGHRETDLAMLDLFGCPGLDRILGAYAETAPLSPGWRERIELHQLFPLLVHTVLFGRSYATQALSIAQRLS
ncbi:fructosamine kinase family protein [Amycolatopsis sp. NBC_01480]|uniref:fructosamine kinase family protein n=1 Tax=Amycolatopsis sp. NBC_01480 TaxID=2903562 RepID=UPI002E2A3D2A|nr:fructosamine kinase family protein [Amycolatopsis sp. NBC_01480]